MSSMVAFAAKGESLNLLTGQLHTVLKMCMQALNCSGLCSVLNLGNMKKGKEGKKPVIKLS